MIDHTDYKDWSEFRNCFLKDLFADGRFISGRLLFRGQSDSNWELTSAYDRWFKKLALDEAQRNPLAIQLLAAFKKELASGGYTEELQMPDDWILSLAQHNGLPTRLLDWSESPYIAALFAFMNHSFTGVAAPRVGIWALDMTCYHWEADRGAQVLNIELPGVNIRLRNQEGRFTLLRTSHQSLDAYVESFTQDGTRPLRKFTIPSSEAAEALSELSAMSISPSRVFPDLQGRAMAATMNCHLKIINP